MLDGATVTWRDALKQITSETDYSHHKTSSVRKEKKDEIYNKLLILNKYKYIL